MNVFLEVDDRKHVLLKQVLVLHLLRHFSEKTDLNTIDDDALKDGDDDVLVQMLKLSSMVLPFLSPAEKCFFVATNALYPKKTPKIS